MNNEKPTAFEIPPSGGFVVIDRVLINKVLAESSTHGIALSKIGRIRRTALWGTRRDNGTPDLVVLLVLSGTGTSDIDGAGESAIGPGTLLVIPPGVGHTYWFHDSGGSEAFVIEVTGPAVEQLVARLRVTRMVPRTMLALQDIAKQWITIALDMLNRDASPECLVAVSCALPMLWHTLCQAASLTENRVVDATLSLAGSAAPKQERVPAPPNLAGLAASAGLSKSHFLASFRRATGLPPLRYIHRQRIHQACAMLETTGMSVKEVAAAAGYADYRYFDRMFRRVLGQTPREYRAINCGWSADTGG